MDAPAPTASAMPPRKEASRATAWVVLCSLLIAAPWFWPFLWGPLSAMWPDLFAWTVGALLITLLPCTREHSVSALAWGWLLAALGSSVLGLLQYLDLENVLYPWVAPTSPGYVTANVHQLNMLATLLAVGLLCVWQLLVRQQLRAGHAVWMAGLLLATLAATASRTGMLHMAVISCLLLYWHHRHWQRVALVIALAWGWYALAANGLPWLAWVTRGIVIDRNIFGRLGQDMACHSRRYIWGNVLDLIAQKPWTGWGPGELLYAHYVTDFGGHRFCEKLSNAHNLPLHLAVTMGIPVAVAVVGLAMVAFWRLKPWQASHPTERLCWGVLALLGVHSLLEYPLWFGVFQLMAALAAWQIYRVRKDLRGNGEARMSLRGRALLSLVLVAALSLVAWDYLKVSQLYIPASQRLERYRDDTFNKSKDTWLFRTHVLIAQVVVTDLKPDNAELVLEGALASLHTAPDSRIIRRVIEAAALLGRSDLVEFHMARYKAAWPKQYEEWVALQKAAAAK